MPSKKVEEFNKERERLNDIVLKYSEKEIKRFLSLDSQVYRNDVLSAKTKEMLGLISSLVLRCDDCIKYHLNQCYEQKVTIEELEEVFSVGLIVGGSITIPHIRRAFEYWEELLMSD
jgi:AhpD family alkylhydroperoxidase